MKIITIYFSYAFVVSILFFMYLYYNYNKKYIKTAICFFFFPFSVPFYFIKTEDTKIRRRALIIYFASLLILFLYLSGSFFVENKKKEAVKATNIEISVLNINDDLKKLFLTLDNKIQRFETMSKNISKSTKRDNIFNVIKEAQVTLEEYDRNREILVEFIRQNEEELILKDCNQYILLADVYESKIEEDYVEALKDYLIRFMSWILFCNKNEADITENPAMRQIYVQNFHQYRYSFDLKNNKTLESINFNKKMIENNPKLKELIMIRKPTVLKAIEKE